MSCKLHNIHSKSMSKAPWVSGLDSSPSLAAPCIAIIGAVDAFAWLQGILLAPEFWLTGGCRCSEEFDDDWLVLKVETAGTVGDLIDCGGNSVRPSGVRITPALVGML